MSGGWGSGQWGSAPWGSGESDLLLLAADAVRENVVRLTFNTAPLFTRVLDPHDASNPARFNITADATSIGMDGEPARPVKPILVGQALVANAAGTRLDVYVDRPFSPYPAKYLIAANHLVSAQDGIPLDNTSAAKTFFGLQRLRAPDLPENAVPSRDIACPQTLLGALGPIPDVTELALGTYAVDDTGDYAFDEGIANLKKRILRRLLTAPGAFKSLGRGYGVGIARFSKKLNVASVRARLAAEAERQIALEPDVAKVRVRAIVRAPGIVVFQVLVRTVMGSGIKVEQPFAIAA